MSRKRKYDDSYIKYGFTEIEVNREIRPQCVICTVVLSNNALKLAKLLRHLHTIHPTLKDQPPEFFEGKCKSLKKMKLGPSGANVALSQQVLTASFEISQLISKSKKAHSIGETLIKPSLLIAANIFGEDAKKKIQNMPLSNNTVKARIGKMSCDIEEQLLGKIKSSPYFALQCDETTDIAQCCQLLVFVRFLDVEDKTIKEELLLSSVLETTSKGIDVMQIISNYFENHDLKWEKLVGFCTDGAPAMLGCRSGLATLVKEKNPSTLTTHCVIHRQALATKTLPEELANVLKLAIKLVNFVKSKALNTRIFKKLCVKLDSEYDTLLFHTEVRWLSKGNMLKRLYELKEEMKIFLNEKDSELLEKFCDLKFELQFAYLVDIFEHLNNLNLQLQVEEAPEYLQEAVIELQNDSDCKNMFDSGMNLEEFWCRRATLHIQLREIALRYLVVFSTTYLCEQGFSSLLVIKNKQRNRLDVSDDMRLAISNIHPRIEKLVKEMQPQKSH
ncbi:protein ZBED8-like [Melanaphis sacchari]|uniref:protein ZBED8-like n=1 Tax=Melanaphis sacchari TaxID=742174 RepID=UPI000DC136F6|nr:protein ZBED8-like [Melanaphis sacchari]